MASWFLERQGNLLGPFSEEQIQGLVVAGQLGPADRVLREGSDQLVSPKSVPEFAFIPDETRTALAMQPVVELSQPSPPKKSRVATRKWVWVAAGLALAAIAALVFWINRDPGNDPNLPEWFQRAHRVPSSYETGKYGTTMPGIGTILLPDAPAPPGFTAKWFEENFTHYMARNEFVFARPKELKLDADGKILAGAKVLLGGHVNDLALVCICTPDGRPVNMYLPKKSLRVRSAGPPRADK